ncbi:hypothetical protein EAF04_009572 [Stromatinia cepivora]|nr:hypothetical protein EAF04_009572 [Stromatinia cepivora]
MFDSVKSHNTSSIKEWFRKANHINTLIPISSTYLLQVGDIWPHSVIKLGVAAREKAWLNQGQNRRDFYDGKHKPSDRRPLLTQWQVAAFKEFHENHQEALVRQFRNLGYALDPRGSEDAELEIAGCPNIRQFLDVGDLNKGIEGLPVVEDQEDEREKMWWEDVEEGGEIENQDIDLNTPDRIWLIDDSDIEEGVTEDEQEDIEPPAKRFKGKGKAIVVDSDSEDGTVKAPILLD